MKPGQDDAVPSANAIQLSNLLKLTALTGDASHAERAEALLKAFAAAIAASPVGHCGLLAASLDRDGLVEIVVRAADPTPFKKAVCSLSVPGCVQFALPGDARVELASIAEQAVPSATSMAYVCIAQVCGAPIRDPEQLRSRLFEVRLRPH
jgi:uncharacterized protein YyaL (SSP411 family)